MDLLIFLHPPVLFQDALYLARKRLVNLELHNLSLEDLTLCIALDELCPCSLLVVFLGHPVHLLLSAVCLELLCLAQSEVPSWILWASENQSPYRYSASGEEIELRKRTQEFCVNRFCATDAREARRRRRSDRNPPIWKKRLRFGHQEIIPADLLGVDI